MSISDEQLAEWRELSNNATDGPWICADSTDDQSDWYSDFDEPMVVTDDSQPGLYSAIARDFCQGKSEGADDAKFVAAARAAMPKLLDEVERLRAEVQRISNHLETCELLQPLHGKLKEQRQELDRHHHEMVQNLGVEAADQRTRAENAEAEVERLREAEGKLHQIRLVTVWTNEDGKRFVFADDLWAVTDPEIQAKVHASTSDTSEASA